MADDGPAVIRVEPDNPIGAGERPEETDLEFGVGFFVDDPGLAAGYADLPVERPLPAGVEDVDVTVLPERILGRDADAALLEPLRDRGDLISSPEVFLEVDEGDDLEGLARRAGVDDRRHPDNQKA